MKALAFLALALGVCLPALAQQNPASGKDSCKIRVSVIQVDQHLPGGWMPRMSAAQAKWWSTKGAKKYPAICLDDKNPEFLVAWSTDANPRITSYSGPDYSQPGITDPNTGATQYPERTVVTTVEDTRCFISILPRAKDGKFEPPAIFFAQYPTEPGLIGRVWGRTATSDYFRKSRTQQAFEASIKFLAQSIR